MYKILSPARKFFCNAEIVCLIWFILLYTDKQIGTVFIIFSFFQYYK